jgi:plasmid stability protein
VADLLIRNLEPELRRKIKERARKSRHSISEEAKTLIQRGLSVPPTPEKLGTFLFSLVEDRYRGDDLLFERNDMVSPPPEFD